MSKIVVIGAQWGDEGKGKIVDWLAERANVVVRFQGGHNAGHTIVVNKKEFKLSILPSGIIRKNKICIIGNGVVLDPWVLLKEIEIIKEAGIEINNKNLIISSTIPLILPIHSIVDNLRENKSGKKIIGTTGRGIGPAYEDKVARRAVRVCDLFDKKLVNEKVNSLVDYHNVWLKYFNHKIVDANTIINSLMNISKKITYFVDEVWNVLDLHNKKKSKILYEGAQGVLLDIDHGTYPFVTSSNTVPSQAFVGSGSSPHKIKKILGVTKAYTTRVGSGPFPSEDFGHDGEKIGIEGKEFGTVTGRKRRCGWLDMVMLKKSIKISGINCLAITKLDVLDQFNLIKICVGYRVDNQKLNSPPVDLVQESSLIPVYKTFRGWMTNTKGLQKYENLPINAKKFLEFIEDGLDCPIDLISTGPERNHLIKINKIF